MLHCQMKLSWFKSTKFFIQVHLPKARGDSTLVEQSTNDPKFEGSTPSSASTGGKNSNKGSFTHPILECVVFCCLKMQQATYFDSDAIAGFGFSL